MILTRGSGRAARGGRRRALAGLRATDERGAGTGRARSAWPWRFAGGGVEGKNGPRCWASGRAGALGCCTSLAGPLGWGKEVAGRDWAWAWSLPGLTVWAGRRVCGLGCSRVWAGLAIGLFLSSFLFYFLFQTPPNLKPFEFKFEFEFKPHSINKIMHQHECTIMLNLNYILITL